MDASSLRSPRGHAVLASVGLALALTTGHAVALDAPRAPFAFENADITTVIAEVARRTATTFLFDPARVRGPITVVAPGDVTPARALELLQSALALRGYAMITRPEATWIVPADPVGRADFVVQVVRLTYADAVEVASTLAWIAPPGVRIVPHVATNSVVIAGHVSGVNRMIDAIR
jgi:type II secretory pathway component GspD/PulD (secretin)